MGGNNQEGKTEKLKKRHKGGKAFLKAENKGT